MKRRAFLNTSLAASMAAAGAGTTALAREGKKIKIIGIACSPRKGKTTATSVGVALEAAAAVNGGIDTELIDLGGMQISGWPGSGAPVEDDFSRLVQPKLKDVALGGLIVGTPVYFRNMSSLCMMFLERLGSLRKPNLLLADKVVGALSVGGYRNGGQELALEQIQTAMLCHEAMIVGGKPGAHQGATLWNAFQDDIMQDEFGIASAKNLGIRVAEAALKLR